MITADSRSTDPYYNLAFEEYIFTHYKGEDIFLLWRNTPCIVVGNCQNICRETRPIKLRELGIPVLRRISGGGAVYHDLGNVNYTHITRQERPINYDKSLGPILAALNAIGVPARKQRTCDLAIGEKKISGSAQRAAGGRLLHHGTLLFDADLAALDRISVQGKNPCVQTKGTQSAICAVTNIRPHLAEDMTIEEFQRRLLEQIEPTGHLELTEEQIGEICRLQDEKYHSWEWTWGKTPSFTYERTGSFAGGPFRVSYQAKRGIVSKVSVEGKHLDGRRAEKLLEGARLSPEVFAEICEKLAGERSGELLELLF